MNRIKQYAAYILPFLILTAMIVPSFAYAQTPSSACPSIRNIGTLFEWGTCIITKSIIPLLFTIGLAAFIFGVVQYMLNPNNSEKRDEGKKYMIWGIIGLFVMVSVWGLVGILSNTFNLNNSAPTLPRLPQ